MKDTLFVCLILLWVVRVGAQSSEPEVVASSGNTFQTNNLQLDWTLGEIAVTTISESNLQITQGFHQPEYMITNITELPPDFGQIQIFPNPTTDFIHLKLVFEQDRKTLIRLVDSTGKLIWAKEINGQTIEESADLGAVPVGSYFLSLRFDENQYSPVYKILKIK